MSVTYGLTSARMRVWLSCLLIGSIACGATGQEYGADMDFMQQQFSPGSWFSGIGASSDLGSSSPLPSLPNPSSDEATQLAPQDYPSRAGPRSYSSSLNVDRSRPYMDEGNDRGHTSLRAGHRKNPKAGKYSVPSHSTGIDGYIGGYGDFGGYGGFDYAPSASAHVDFSSPRFGAPGYNRRGSSNSHGASDGNPEPVFSDVSDLAPVYAFRSRSRYQRGRRVFSQTHYTPGDPVPFMPASRPTSKPTQQSSPAKAPPKGGF